MNLKEVENRLGYKFKDREILNRALTLPSAGFDYDNQTLEFFGDAILEMVVTEKIFDINLSEGELTDMRKAIVADKSLAKVSKKLGLDKFLIKSQYDNNNKKSIPSAYEAVVAAIYLDGGMNACKKFVYATLDFSVRYVDENYKGRLQELLQGSGQSHPEYDCKDVGDERRHEFVAEVNIEGKIFSGRAPTKQEAERLAAKSAVEFLESK